MPERLSLVERLGQTLPDRGLTPAEVVHIAGAAPDGTEHPFFLPKPRLSVV